MVVTSFFVLQLLFLAPFAALALDFHVVKPHELAFGARHRPAKLAPRDHGHNRLSLSLFHRDAIPGRNFSGHRHRLDRLLERDSRRVATLTRRLSAARYHVDDFGSEVVSGLEEGSGEYFVRVGVGVPPREQYLVVDSGSDIVWIQCQPCSQCYAQSEPVFDPAESASFAGVACGSPICGLLLSG
ncbi:Eukaryotic aspartyl protease, partial [Musa troglodytarum]